MPTIRGELVRGIGVAVHTVSLQTPLLRPYLPEIDGYHKGTINVRLERPLSILSPDVVTPPLVWLSSVPPEVFSFVKIGFQIEGAAERGPVSAHIYRAHLSPHLADPYVIEILAPFLELTGARGCLVHLPRAREVPFLVI